jgi:RNA polymerase sigma-70 factor (ECF subfamily)
MNTFTDEELMACVARDEVAAFETLYDRHAARALRVARRLCADPELANEAVQDAFLSIWRGRTRYDAASGTFASWAMTVVRNRAIDLIRKEASGVTRAPLDDDLLATLTDGAPGTAELADRHEQVKRIRERLDELPEAQREALILSFYVGLSHGQIAQRLALPVGTVKGRVRLALTKLREALTPEPAAVS